MASIPTEVSVIMCAYTQDRWEDLKQAIQSVQEQTVRPAEVILVIDHNHDLFEKSYQTFQGVRVIENQEPRGLAGARNSGVEHSSTPLIAFIDEDAIAAPDWIENLLSGYIDPLVVGVGGAVKPRWITRQPKWFPEEFNWVVGCSYKGLPLTPAPVRNPIGCNMSFLRDEILLAGGFRNGIGRVSTNPVGCEETELSIRIKQLKPGSIIQYQPKAVVYHKVPNWRTSWSYFIRRCYSEGLSKALVTQYVGSGDGLSSERSYVISTLTQGVIDNLNGAIFRGNPNGFGRAGSIIAGAAVTTTGYLVGSIFDARRKASAGVLNPKISSPAGES